MADYPMTTSERAAKRESIREHLLTAAERKALYVFRSLKCSGYDGTVDPRHAGEVGGCANDGSHCICICHDQHPEVAHP